MHERERIDRLRHAILENREVAFRQIGDEPAARVTRNHIGGDVCHFSAKRRRLLRGQVAGSEQSRRGQDPAWRL